MLTGVSASDLRVVIAKHEAGLMHARSPRARLTHLFRLTVARDTLKQIVEQQADG